MRYFAILALFAFPAQAQDAQCGPVEQVLASLASEYGETIRFTGNNANGLFTVLVVNAETKTWTALHIDNAGKACLVDAGQGGEFYDKQPEGVDG